MKTRELVEQIIEALTLLGYTTEQTAQAFKRFAKEWRRARKRARKEKP